MGHNKDVVSAWGEGGVCDIPHRIREKVPDAIEVGTSRNLVTRFKVMRAPLGPKRTISTWLGAGRYKWYQSRSPNSMWGVCLAP